MHLFFVEVPFSRQGFVKQSQEGFVELEVKTFSQTETFQYCFFTVEPFLLHSSVAWLIKHFTFILLLQYPQPSSWMDNSVCSWAVMTEWRFICKEITPLRLLTVAYLDLKDAKIQIISSKFWAPRSPRGIDPWDWPVLEGVNISKGCGRAGIQMVRLTDKARWKRVINIHQRRAIMRSVGWRRPGNNLNTADRSVEVKNQLSISRTWGEELTSPHGREQRTVQRKSLAQVCNTIAFQVAGKHQEIWKTHRTTSFVWFFQLFYWK